MTEPITNQNIELFVDDSLVLSTTDKTIALSSFAVKLTEMLSGFKDTKFDAAMTFSKSVHLKCHPENRQIRLGLDCTKILEGE